MPQHYHHGLVFVSLLVAVLASYTALNLASRIRLSQGVAARAWLLGGGFSMGIGIWAMHFVGMLALALPLPIIYDPGITLLSLLTAIAVSTFALRMASSEHVTRRELSWAGVAMGVGICAMHYVGMAAIEIRPPIRYDLYWVIASFAIAVAASFAALWVAFTERSDKRWWKHRRAFGALGMGFAISGMHYAGMAAAQFPADAVSPGMALVDRGWLAGAVTVMTLFVLFGTLLLLLIDAQGAARAASMQASLAEAAESSRAKDEFLAMLGHELRNPLASITAAIHLLDKAQPGHEQWSFARDVIGRQSQHLNAMVNDLLDVGRAINGKMSLDMQAMELDQAVRNALGSLATAGKTAERRVQYRGEPVRIRGDRTRIEQVITNLVANAAAHTAAGGSIDVSVRLDGAEAVVVVSDDGVGLEPETAARVFELFFQGRQEISRARGGLGVGLTLVQRIIEAHDGAVSVASEGAGKGASFTIRVPATEALVERPVAAAGLKQASPRSIVLVEDADDTRSGLERALGAAGHRVLSARTGVEGLQCILDAQPDVALVDIGLPGMDGYELARRVRSGGSRAYLIALTGYGSRSDRERAQHAGFDSHLTKPATVSALLQVLAEIPQRSSRPRRA